MVKLLEIDAHKLNNKVAEELKKDMKQPAWSLFIKTGTGKQRPPQNPDWWYVRSASILRRIYIDGPVGVQRLRTYYGGLKRRGHKPSHFRRGSGKVIREILKDLENMKYLEKVDKPKKGRVVTREGKKFIETVAKTVV